jgi:ankyrin repeat protein
MGLTSLQIACKAGDIIASSILLSHGSNPNEIAKSATPGHNGAPLHIAAKQNKIDMIPLLLKHGARIDVVDIFGWTPLFR